MSVRHFFIFIFSIIPQLLFATFQEKEESIANRLTQSKQLIDEEHFAEAITILKGISQENIVPATQLEVYLSFVEVAIKVSDYTTAEFYLEQIDGMDSDLTGEWSNKVRIELNRNVLLFRLGDYDLTLKNCLRITKLIQGREDEEYFLRFQNLIGLCYTKKFKMDSAFQYFDIAIKGYKRRQDDIRLANLLQNKAFAFMQHGLNDSTESLLNESINLAVLGGNRELTVEGIMLLGKLFIIRKQLPTAKLFLDSANRHLNSEHLDLIDTKHDLAKYYSELYLAEPNYQEALKWLVRTEALEDSLENKEILLRIALAPSRQTIQNQENLLSENKQMVIILSVMIMLVIIILFLQSRILRIKSRSAAQLQSQNQEIQDQNSELQLQSEELNQQKAYIEDRNKRLEFYLKKLELLATTNYVNRGESEKAFVKICKAAQKTLQASRVSLWVYDEIADSIVCKILLENGKQLASGQTLFRKDYPSYFAAISKKVPVVSEDTFNDKAMLEFASSGYLAEQNIKSLLDAPFLINGQLAGIICCEQIGETRKWHPEDAIFLSTLCDFVSISLLGDKIRRQNQELTESNERLEAAVKKRTSALEQQNQQLTEYAFINSHLLRAPLARILGLSQLFASDISYLEDQEMVASLISSTEELDQIIRRISQVLYQGTNLTREDINLMIEKNFSKLPGENLD